MFHFLKRKAQAPLNAATGADEDSGSDAPAGVDEARLLRLCVQFGQIMMPQLARAGLEPGMIEPGQLAASSQACGYVHGICGAIAEASGLEPGDDHGTVLASWAFADLYGAAGGTLHGRAVEAGARSDIAIIQGNLLARDDWRALTEGAGRGEASGFTRIALGDSFEP